MTPVLPQILKKGLLRAAVMMALAGAVFYPAAARACADPVGTEGQIIFNEDYKVLQYCDNVNWIAVGPSPFVTSGALTTPLMSGSYYNATTMNGAHGIMVVGDLAYVTVMDNNRLVILDISNPASPTLVGSVTDGTTLWGAATVVVDGSFAYVTTYYGDSMTIVDVSNPAAPVIRGTISNANLDGAAGIDKRGNHVFVAGRFNARRLTAINISDPDNPTSTSSLFDLTNLDGLSEIKIVGNYAYGAAYVADRMTIVDISNPASMSVVGSVYHGTNLGGANGIDVTGDFAYVTAYDTDRLTVVDVSNPATPVIRGSVTSTDLDGASFVKVRGNYAYVTSEIADRLVVVDISDPDAPTIVGSLTSTNLNAAQQIFLKDNYAYVSAYDADRMSIIEIGGGSVIPDVTAGLIAHWRLDETAGTTALDSAGTYNGTYTNGPVSTTGRIGNARDFVGASSQYVQVANNAALNLATYTTMAWVNGNNPPAAGSVHKVIDKDTRYTMNWNHFSIPVSCEHYNAVWHNTGTGPALSADRWYHMACTYNGSDLIMYIDGVETGRATGVPVPTASTSVLRIGEIYNGGNAFDGRIDDVRVYNRALSQEEIATAMFSCSEPTGNAGDIRYDGPQAMMMYCNGPRWVPFSGKQILPFNTELAVHLPLEEGTALTAASTTGSNTGTMTNMDAADWVTGRVGSYALDFDGSDDYVAIANPSTFQFNAAGKYTWAAWVRPDNYGEWNNIFGQFVALNTQPIFAIYAHTSADGVWGVTRGIAAGVDVGGGVNIIARKSLPNVITTGTWTHVTVTYDGALTAANRIRIYIDGVYSNGPVYNNGAVTNFTPTLARIGHSGFDTEFMDGQIDDFRFYQRLLTDTEIALLGAHGPATGCLNPAGPAGRMIYNNVANVVQFCNGKNWIAAGK